MWWHSKVACLKGPPLQALKKNKRSIEKNLAKWKAHVTCICQINTLSKF